jgi:2-iminobutanoate/2-iminopropanoate deaminase
MDTQGIHTPNAPAAVGPYSQAVRHGPWLFVSGQIALPPAHSVGEGKPPQLVSDDVAHQTDRVLDNLQAILQAAGADFSRVVKVTIYLTDINDFGVVNERYAHRVGSPPPARATVAVQALPLGARIEIDAICALPDNDS